MSEDLTPQEIAGRNEIEKAWIRASRSGSSWNETPEHIRKGLPAPPVFEEFSNQDEYEDARAGWYRSVAPSLQYRMAVIRHKHSLD